MELLILDKAIEKIVEIKEKVLNCFKLLFNLYNINFPLEIIYTIIIILKLMYKSI